MPLNQVQEPAFSHRTIIALEEIGLVKAGELLMFSVNELQSISSRVNAPHVLDVQRVLRAHGQRLLEDLPYNTSRQKALKVYAERAKTVYHNLDEAPVSVLFHGDSPIVISNGARSAITTVKELRDAGIKTVGDYRNHPEIIRLLLNRPRRADWIAQHQLETPEYELGLIDVAFGLKHY